MRKKKQVIFNTGRFFCLMDILTLEKSKGNGVDGHLSLETSKGNSMDGHSYTRDIKGK
jgi:hypothetical protein